MMRLWRKRLEHPLIVVLAAVSAVLVHLIMEHFLPGSIVLQLIVLVSMTYIVYYISSWTPPPEPGDFDMTDMFSVIADCGMMTTMLLPYSCALISLCSSCSDLDFGHDNGLLLVQQSLA